MPLQTSIATQSPLAAPLSRSLIEGRNADDRFYADSIGQALVICAVGMKLSRGKVSALPKWRLKRVLEYMEAHIDEPLGIAGLAALAGLSRMHFAAQFRSATGYRPNEYVVHQRIEQAKTMLADGKLPIVEIALSVGFSAQAHFSTAFKRLTGATPGHWRAASRQAAKPQNVPASERMVSPNAERLQSNQV